MKVLLLNILLFFKGGAYLKIWSRLWKLIRGGVYSRKYGIFIVKLAIFRFWLNDTFEKILRFLQTGNILGNSRLRIYDPWEKSPPKKTFGTLFRLETSKYYHSRGGNVSFQVPLSSSQCTGTSQKCPFIPKIRILFSKIAL